MCISCGCGKANDAHGDERNITVDTLQRAADASNLTLGQVITNMGTGSMELASSGVPRPEPAGKAVKERLDPTN